MARPKKKGTSGAAKNFITRTQAVRKLQITLPDFRRLCIFKGIYPREPRNKKKAAKNATPAATFYYTRDIQYLLHEPLLQKFREQKALAKKIGRLLGRGEVGDAGRAERNLAPRITLDHVIKERYPTFVDALRDLDDCLCMLYLFASLPSTEAVPAKTIALCQRLTLEFEHYLIVSHSLRKTFLSIKGIYYQATIQGQDILWLVPYKFVQRMTGDIDFRIMGTFVEFYTTLLGFVNYRLYTSVGLVYPPKFDQKRGDQGAELGAFQLEGRAVDEAEQMETDTPANGVPAIEADQATTAKAQEAANAISASAPVAPAENDDDDEPEGIIDEFEAAAEGADILPQPAQSSQVAASLFSQHVFFLGRETPRAPLEFLLKAFGCKSVGWDAVLGEGAWTTDESDPRITHQVVDRPAASIADVDDDALNAEEAEAVRQRIRAANLRIPGRTYVQPQWVWDCVNAGKLVRPDLYAPGATLPPHLSPWVKPKRGAYDPTAPLEQDDTEDVEAQEKDVDAEEEELQGLIDDVDPDDADDALSDADEDPAQLTSSKNDDDFAGFSDDDEDDQDAAPQKQHQRELEAEAKGLPTPAAASKKQKVEQKRKAADRKKRAEAEELERQKMMLPRRKRKLLDKMMYSNAQTDAEADKLRKKRRRLEREKAANAL